MPVLAAALAPIARADFAPGLDIPNHLARAVVNHRLGADADLAAFYLADWSVLPNLAIDLVLWPLLHVFAPWDAARVFVAAAALLLIGGVAFLRRQVHGRVGWLPMAAPLFVYSLPFALGLANYYFAVGLTLVALGFWVRGETAPWPRRLAVSSLLATGLFLSHLFATAAYGLVIVSLRLGAAVRNRRLDWRGDLVALGQFAVPAVLWLAVKSPTQGTETLYGPLHERFFMAISPVAYRLHSYEAAMAGVLLVLLVWLLATRRLVFPSPFAWALVALAVASVAMPLELFGVWIVHVRLPLLAALIVLAVADVRIDDLGPRRLVAACLVAMTALHLVKVDAAIAACDADKRRFVAAVRDLPRGARVLPVVEDGASPPAACKAGDYWHFPALAVIERSVFSPMMFTHMQPLALRPPWDRYAQLQPRPASPGALAGDPNAPGETDWNEVVAAGWRRDFDYLIWLHPGTTPTSPPAGLRRVGGDGFFTLFRIAG